MEDNELWFGPEEGPILIAPFVYFFVKVLKAAPTVEIVPEVIESFHLLLRVRIFTK